MNSMEILSLTATELSEKIKQKEITVVEATKAVLEQIKKAEPVINSYVTVDEEGALAQAEEVQKKIDAGELTGPLAGVPVAVKDNMCVEGQLTTCSSKILYNFKPTFSSEAVLNLKKAGMVIVGKTNMDEFAMGSTTETSYYGPTKIHTIRSMSREDPPEEAARQWQHRNALWHWDLIPVDRSVSQVPSVEW